MKRKLTLALLLVVLVAAEVTLVGSGTIGKLMPKWSVSEQCTPVAPGDTSGSVGSASLDAFKRSTSIFAIDNDFTLTDPTSGVFKGNVVASPVSGRKVHLDVAGKLNFLVADRTVDPVWFDAGEPLLTAPQASLANGGQGTTNNAYAVAVDPFDNSFFVSSYGTVDTGVWAEDYYQITKYDADGNFISWFGEGTNGLGAPYASSGSANGYFGGPLPIAVNPVDGSVAVGDGANSRIQIFTPDVNRELYTYSTKVGTLGAGDSQFAGALPIPVVWDSTGVLYAADRGNSQIKKFTVVGTTVTFVTKVAVTGFVVNTPIYELTMSSTDVLYASLVTSLLAGEVGTIRSYNTSLVAQQTFTFPAPAGTSAGIFNIEADATGIWANWGKGNYLVHYAGATLVEDNRWYSGYRASVDLNTNYGIASKTTGEILVLFKSTTYQTEPGLYGVNRLTSFDWNQVPLSDAIEGYMLECDSTLGGMTYSYDADSDPYVIFPAWSGDVWTKLKEICTAFQVDIYPDNNVIRVGDVGARTIVLRNHSPLKLIPSNLFGGQQLVMVAQNPTAGGGIVFDAGTAGTRFQIDVGQSNTVIVNTLNYPVSVDPLVPSDSLPILPGQYYVLDSTGTHVPAATWLAAGATVLPDLGDSPGQVKFTLTGPTAAISGYTGPFTFADSLATTGRAALAVTGMGVFTVPKSYTFETGANPTKTTQLVAKTINSFAIASMTQIFGIAPAAIDDVSGIAVTVTFDMPTADLLGFGLTTGSIFTAEDSKYRITDVTFGGLKASVTAVRHITLDDVDTATTGLTVDQRDAIWTGYSIDDRGIKPVALSL